MKFNTLILQVTLIDLFKAHLGRYFSLDIFEIILFLHEQVQQLLQFRNEGLIYLNSAVLGSNARNSKEINLRLDHFSHLLLLKFNKFILDCLVFFLQAALKLSEVADDFDLVLHKFLVGTGVVQLAILGSALDVSGEILYMLELLLSLLFQLEMSFQVVYFAFQCTEGFLEFKDLAAYIIPLVLYDQNLLLYQLEIVQVDRRWPPYSTLDCTTRPASFSLTQVFYILLKHFLPVPFGFALPLDLRQEIFQRISDYVFGLLDFILIDQVKFELIVELFHGIIIRGSPFRFHFIIVRKIENIYNYELTYRVILVGLLQLEEMMARGAINKVKRGSLAHEFVFFLGLPFALPVLVGYVYSVDIFLAGDLFLFVSVVFYSAVLHDIREAKDYHDVIDELYLYAYLQQDGRTWNFLLTQVFGIVFNDGRAKVKEKIEETVIKGQYKILSLYKLIKISIFSLPHLNSFGPLIRIKELFGPEPLIFELFIQPINLRSQSFRIDVLAFNQFSELLLRNYYVSLAMSAEQKDLLQVFGQYIASFHQQELAFPEKTLGDYFLLIACSQIVQVVFKKQDIFFVIGQFPVGLSGQVFGKLRLSDPLVDLYRSSLELKYTDITCSQTIHHEFRFSNLLRLIGNVFFGDFFLENQDLMLQIGMFGGLLNADPFRLLDDEHLLQEISQFRRNVSIWNNHLLLNLFQNAHHFEGVPGQSMEKHEIDGDSQ